MKYTIDAQGKKLGRVAAEAARALQGKNDPHYERHVMADVTVEITNAQKLDIGPRQLERVYKRYSGYPGGLTLEKGAQLLKRKGIVSVIEHAVSGMLPKNTHRSKLVHKLVISE